MKFSNEEVSNYYDQTEVHYRYFWKLSESLALHYGIWRPGIRTLTEALLETNRTLADMARITAADHVLDAGCGVGGSSIYLARHIGCTAVGITLSAKQVQSATQNAAQNGVSDRVQFLQRDYTATDFEAGTFDVVWGIECHLTESSKAAFVAEAMRLLKPGGRLIVGEYFKTQAVLAPAAEQTLLRWLNLESIADMVTLDHFKGWLNQYGFGRVQTQDVTREITPSARMIYRAALLGAIGTKAYNTFVKKASYFSRVHYKAQIAQYRALRMNAWQYHIVYAEKPL